MRDRLIALLGDFPIFHSTMKERWMPEAVERLADHLIANGVIVPPVKVGDNLYDVTEFIEGRDCPEVYELQDNVLYVEKTKGGNILFSYDGVYIDHDAIGKTVFLTREEAEKALKERSADDGT